jgi:hypothetical protein
VRHSESEADEPGYLSRAQASQEPQASNAFSASDGGDRTMGQYSLHLDATLGAHTDLFVRAYANRYEDLRFVRFSENVSQQERYSDEEQKGLIAALRVSPEVTTLHAQQADPRAAVRPGGGRALRAGRGGAHAVAEDHACLSRGACRRRIQQHAHGAR